MRECPCGADPLGCVGTCRTGGPGEGRGRGGLGLTLLGGESRVLRALRDGALPPRSSAACVSDSPVPGSSPVLDCRPPHVSCRSTAMTPPAVARWFHVLSSGLGSKAILCAAWFQYARHCRGVLGRHRHRSVSLESKSFILPAVGGAASSGLGWPIVVRSVKASSLRTAQLVPGDQDQDHHSTAHDSAAGAISEDATEPSAAVGWW